MQTIRRVITVEFLPAQGWAEVIPNTGPVKWKVVKRQRTKKAGHLK